MRQPRLEAALKACGAVLVRANKHLIYRLPNGKNLVIAASPSDNRAERNALANLRKLLKETS